MGGSICRLSALLRAFLKENSLIEWPGSLTSWLASSFVLQQAVCLFDVFEIDTSAIKSLMLGADITIKNVFGFYLFSQLWTEGGLIFFLCCRFFSDYFNFW